MRAWLVSLFRVLLCFVARCRSRARRTRSLVCSALHHHRSIDRSCRAAGASCGLASLSHRSCTTRAASGSGRSSAGLVRAPFLRRWRTFGAEWHRNRWSWQTQWRVNEAYAWIGPCTGAQVRLCPAVVRAAAQARRPGLLRDAGHAQPLQHQAHHRHGASSVQRASSTSPHSLASERVCVCVRAALQENERVQYTDLHGLRHSVRVPSGCVWVEGDNKAVSIDSRIYGPLPVNLISGKVLVRVRAAHHRSEVARFRSPDGAHAYCCWSHGSCYLYDRSAGYLPTLYIEHTHSLSLTYSRFNCIYHTFHSIPCHSTTTTTSLDSEHLMIVVDSIESQLQEPTDQLRARARVPLGRRRRHCTRNARLVATSAMQRAP